MVSIYRGNIEVKLFETPYSGNMLIPGLQGGITSEDNFYFSNNAGIPTLFGRTLIRNICSNNIGWPPIQSLRIGVFDQFSATLYGSGEAPSGSTAVFPALPELAESVSLPLLNAITGSITNARSLITPSLLSGNYNMINEGDNIEFAQGIFWENGLGSAVWNPLYDDVGRPLCSVYANNDGDLVAFSPFYGALPNGNNILSGTDFNGGLYNGGVPISVIPDGGVNYLGVGITYGSSPGIYKAILSASIPNFPSSGFVVNIIEDLVEVILDNAVWQNYFATNGAAILAGSNFFLVSAGGFPWVAGQYSALTDNPQIPYLIFNKDFSKYWSMSFSPQTANLAAMLATSISNNDYMTVGLNSSGILTVASLYTNAGYMIVGSNYADPIYLPYDFPPNQISLSSLECLPTCKRC